MHFDISLDWNKHFQYIAIIISHALEYFGFFFSFSFVVFDIDEFVYMFWSLRIGFWCLTVHKSFGMKFKKFLTGQRPLSKIIWSNNIGVTVNYSRYHHWFEPFRIMNNVFDHLRARVPLSILLTLGVQSLLVSSNYFLSNCFLIRNRILKFWKILSKKYLFKCNGWQ